MDRSLPLLVSFLVTFLGSTGSAQAGPAPQGPELVARRFTPILDGDLADWKGLQKHDFRRDQIFDGADRWKGAKDLSAQLLVSWDNNRLYLAGTVRDDHFAGDELAAQGQVDCVELHVGGDTRDAATRTERRVLRLFPLQHQRKQL